MDNAYPSAPDSPDETASQVYIIKLAGACNLNCSYCYVYNLGDTSYQERPARMDFETAVQALDRIYGYARRQKLEEVKFVLHGGEPLLVGKSWMKRFLDEVYGRLPEGMRVEVGIQTNGTLIDEEWARLLGIYRVDVGVSIDGLPEFHDRYRVDHGGEGSYEEVEEGLTILRETEEVNWGVLVVANPECPGVDIYHHLRELGVEHMDFLWPDYHHDDPPPWTTGTLAQYYMDLFDTWYEVEDEVEIRFFLSLIKAMMGKGTGIDALGPEPLSEVVIEADGALEPLDVLRICEDHMTDQGLTVEDNTIEDLRATSLFQKGLHNQSLLPRQCTECPAYDVCGGGYLPHRWGNGQGFHNPSVHCYDLLALIDHVHGRVMKDIRQAA